MASFGRGISRRIALTSFLTTSAAVLAPNAVAARSSNKSTDLEKAVETLRVAMLEGDGKTLQAMLHDHLTYMHSSGHSQSKTQLVRDLAGKKFFAGLTYSDQKVDVVEQTGTVVQTVDQAKNLPDGKTRASKIKVLQTWLYTGGEWTLLSRVSAIIYSPLAAQACARGAAAAQSPR